MCYLYRILKQGINMAITDGLNTLSQNEVKDKSILE